MAAFLWELAESWLKAHPGWHETREVAEGLGYLYPSYMAQILHRVPGIKWQWRGAMVQMLWSLDA